MRKYIFALLIALVSTSVYSQKATWIYFPGDYEIWLGNEMQNRRTERGAFFPPFWKMDSHFVLVEFSKKLELEKPEQVDIFVEGQYNVKLDGKLLMDNPSRITIPAGSHSLNIKVHNQANVPAIYVKGETFGSDSSWLVTYEDKEWIDESGKASDTSSGTEYMDVGFWNFDTPENKPSEFKLSVTPLDAVKVEDTASGQLIDFGKETFGFVKFHGLKGDGRLTVYYGESAEEALSTEFCETLDNIEVTSNQASDLVIDNSKAFRYIYIEKDPSISYDSVSMLYEYLPLEYRGSFKCNDDLINKIWEISAYTMHLTSRELFIDGIKRDRWVWSGDAYQSYLMNYYLFFDTPSVYRTMLYMRGKDPVTSHINTIMDYTFYWFMGIYDYLQYVGDTKFVEQFYPRMTSLMNYCLERRNEQGMMEGLAGDWVFLDWADFTMSKSGELSFEQLLFCRSLETMALCAEIVGNKEDQLKYEALSKDLKDKLFNIFWSEDKGAFVHNREDGKLSEQVTPYTNMFAVLFDYLDKSKREDVKNNVLLNPEALKITTPYMRFYELEALCDLGEHDFVMKEIRDYWGGMLALDATSFWEKYNPNEEGVEHLSMYGRPFGKSLCHAWGASPIYLLGKHYLGVKPTSNGYETYTVEPNLADLKWMEGTIPTPNGDIKIYCSRSQFKIKSDTGTGKLILKSKKKPVCKGAVIKSLGHNSYELTIEKNKEYKITYKSI